MSESKALATTEPTQLAQFGELSVQGLIERKRKIGEVMKSVMRDGEHYGKIPGCGDKPTLFKAGAEILATTFALAPRFKITRTDLPNGHREYEIVCALYHIPTGLEVGEGVGCCSTLESKYRWRRGERACPECGKPTLLKSKQKPEWFCWAKKGGCGATFDLNDPAVMSQNTDRMENPDPADQHNTVLKMAKKRAQVDATLTATGASDILTQDIEDLPAPDDFIDAEFADVPKQAKPSNGHTDDATMAAIDGAATVKELRALVPSLQKLKGATRDKARERYAARVQQLQAGVA